MHGDGAAPSAGAVKADSVDSETAALTAPPLPGSRHSSQDVDLNADADVDVNAVEGVADVGGEPQPQQPDPAREAPHRPPPRPETRTKQRRFAQQRSILKNSHEHASEEAELIEAKKQLILRRRRLFSHYRQYEQWRRRQFSYDPSYYRPNPLPIGQAACSDYIAVGGVGGAGAFRRRRQYRRQYSCAERSREGSRESRDSPSAPRLRQAAPGGDPGHADHPPSTHSHSQSQAERTSFEGSECGALAYQPLHYNSRNFHMLHEEQSTTISERCTRSRINSAIFVSTEGKGFDSIEFLRRHGSQSVLCRKAKSAENITDNDRKKSFSGKRRWRTDESAEAIDEQPKDGEDTELELQHIRGSNETRTLSVLNSNNESLTTDLGFAAGRSAAITTSNVVVGSISIEAPPAYLKGETLSASNSSTELQHDLSHSYMRNQTITTASHDSTDTVEELILIPRERVLVHQRSSTSTNRSQSPTISPQNSPKTLSLKGVKQKLNALPMVSVSGPSPPHEEANSSECL